MRWWLSAIALGFASFFISVAGPATKEPVLLSLRAGFKGCEGDFKGGSSGLEHDPRSYRPTDRACRDVTSIEAIRQCARDPSLRSACVQGRFEALAIFMLPNRCPDEGGKTNRMAFSLAPIYSISHYLAVADPSQYARSVRRGQVSPDEGAFLQAEIQTFLIKPPPNREAFGPGEGEKEESLRGPPLRLYDDEKCDGFANDIFAAEWKPQVADPSDACRRSTKRPAVAFEVADATTLLRHRFAFDESGIVPIALEKGLTEGSHFIRMSHEHKIRLPASRATPLRGLLTLTASPELCTPGQARAFPLCDLQRDEPLLTTPSHLLSARDLEHISRQILIAPSGGCELKNGGEAWARAAVKFSEQIIDQASVIVRLHSRLEGCPLVPEMLSRKSALGKTFGKEKEGKVESAAEGASDAMALRCDDYVDIDAFHVCTERLLMRPCPASSLQLILEHAFRSTLQLCPLDQGKRMIFKVDTSRHMKNLNFTNPQSHGFTHPRADSGTRLLTHLKPFANLEESDMASLVATTFDSTLVTNVQLSAGCGKKQIVAAYFVSDDFLGTGARRFCPKQRSGVKSEAGASENKVGEVPTRAAFWLDWDAESQFLTFQANSSSGGREGSKKPTDYLLILEPLDEKCRFTNISAAEALVSFSYRMTPQLTMKSNGSAGKRRFKLVAISLLFCFLAAILK